MRSVAPGSTWAGGADGVISETSRLWQVAVPTVILHGTADASIPVLNAYRLAVLMPAAKVELFDDAGHLFWWEDPDRTTTVLTAHATG